MVGRFRLHLHPLFFQVYFDGVGIGHGLNTIKCANDLNTVKYVHDFLDLIWIQ